MPPGKRKSADSGTFLYSALHVTFHDVNSSASLGLSGIVLVFFLPFVIRFGITTSVAVTLLHLRDRASLMRHAVNRVVESTARSFGGHSFMMLSNCSVDRVRACPEPPLFGIYFVFTSDQTKYLFRLVGWLISCCLYIVLHMDHQISLP